MDYLYFLITTTFLTSHLLVQVKFFIMLELSIFLSRVHMSPPIGFYTSKILSFKTNVFLLKYIITQLHILKITLYLYIFYIFIQFP